MGGVFSLLLWSLSASLILLLKKVPPLQLLAMTCSVGFIITLFHIAYTKKWSSIRCPWHTWVVGGGLIILSEIGYISAFHFAPAAQVDLINYLWPLLVILGSTILPNESFRLSHLFSQILGFMAVWVLFHQNGFSSSVTEQKIIGYLLALMAAVCWAGYTLYTRKHRAVSSHMMGMYLGMTAVVCFIFHLLLEKTTFILNRIDWFVILVMGIGMDGLAYLFWDYGVKKGNFRLLSVLSYFTPVVSITFLVLFNFVISSWTLYISFGLLMGSMATFSISEKIYAKSKLQNELKL